MKPFLANLFFKKRQDCNRCYLSSQPIQIRSFYDIIESSNSEYNSAYLNSIQYMLLSKLYMKKLVDDSILVTESLNAGCSVLDIGTGSGVFAYSIKQHKPSLVVHGLETECNQSQTDPDFIETSKVQSSLYRCLERKVDLHFKQYNGIEVPFEKESFDAIVAYAVYEHVGKDEVNMFIQNVYNLLKPKGLFWIFNLPRMYSWCEHIGRIFGLGGHETLYLDDELPNKLQPHGFELLDFSRTQLIFENPHFMTNPISGGLEICDRILCRWPFEFLAHHNNYVFKKL